MSEARFFVHGCGAIIKCLVLLHNVTFSFVLQFNNCLSAATDVCIAILIEEELLPLQHSIANGSSLLNSADQHFVSVFFYIVTLHSTKYVASYQNDLIIIFISLYALCKQLFANVHICI